MGAGGGGGGGFQPNGKLAVGLAGLATAISLAISAGAIYKHLAHYSVPRCVVPRLDEGLIDPLEEWRWMGRMESWAQVSLAT